MRRSLFLAAALVAAGCADAPTHPKCYPVTGKVTAKVGGTDRPPAGAFLAFHPAGVEPGNGVSSNTTVGEDGSFKLSTYAEGDGAPAGEYAVTVIWDARAKPGGGELRGPLKDELGGRYADPKTTPLKAKVEPKAGNEFTFVVQ